VAFIGQQDVTTPFISTIGEVRVTSDEPIHEHVVAPGGKETDPGGQALQTVSFVTLHGS
jgi:hypothetical protein